MATIIFLVLIALSAYISGWKEAVFFLLVAFLLVVSISTICVETDMISEKALPYIGQTIFSALGVVVLFRILLKCQFSVSRISNFKAKEPYEFTPLDSPGNDPRLLSRYPIAGADPRKRREDAHSAESE